MSLSHEDLEKIAQMLATQRNASAWKQTAAICLTLVLATLAGPAWTTYQDAARAERMDSSSAAASQR
jgi:hypothetical protein